jgi:ApbE superfamily uncharacterized protein (UPF0280 family)
MVYEPRTYRRSVAPTDLVCFEVVVRETDLMVCAESELADEVEDLVVQARWEIEEFSRTHPYFAESLSPIEPSADAPPLVQRMSEASMIAGVGPMAAVAGAMSEHVARGLESRSSNVIVENGGDIYMMGDQDRVVSFWAGEQGVGGVGLRIPAGLQPISVCTSSGRLGHSTSFGSADAVAVLARNGSLADAVATALANQVSEPDDIEQAIEAARNILGVLGVVATIDGHVGAWGNVHLVALGTE